MSKTIRKHGGGCGMPWREMYAPTALERDMDWKADGMDIVHDRSWKHCGNSIETVCDPKAKRLLKRLASKARRKVAKVTDEDGNTKVFAVLGNKSRLVAFSDGECVSVSANEFKEAMNNSDFFEFYYNLLNYMLSCIAERVAEGKVKSMLVV